MQGRLTRIARGLRPGRGVFGADATPPGGLVHLRQIGEDNRTVLEMRVRALATSAYLGEREALCRVLGRYKMFVDTRDRGLASHLMLDGYWEIWLTRFLARAVQPGMACVDVGANLGYYALLMADLVGPRGRVLAVEPNPAIARLLRSNLDVNGFSTRAEVRPMALGDGSLARARLAIPVGEPKNAALLPPEAGAGAAGGVEVVEVPVAAFDALDTGLPRIDLVKIDAEGAEDAILRGMAATLRRDRPILVLEFNPARPYDGHAVLAALLEIYGAMQELDIERGLRSCSAEAVMAATDREDRLLVFGDAARLEAAGAP
ncbi:FkbM family methyltransferase [Roseicella aquatilis]|nr:FkbM family methyltransferase [Roseicella aquatilis]